MKLRIQSLTLGLFLGLVAATGPAVLAGPTNAATIVFMKSKLGAPRAGQYALSARVVTVSPDSAAGPVIVNLPYNHGQWQQSEPPKLALVKGKNVLQFDRKPEHRGVTIKDFTLTPIN